MPREPTVVVMRHLAAGSRVERIEALDVLTHALEFVASDDALEIWRRALHRRAVDQRTSAALDELITYLIDQHARGNYAAASEICDCLDGLVPAADRVSRRPG